MSAPDPVDLAAADVALLEARARGAVDDVLLSALRSAPLHVGVDRSSGTPRPAVTAVGAGTSVLAWTTAARAARAGWDGPLVQQPGREVAALLRGTGLGLALNLGEQAGVGLDPAGVERLAGPVPVPAGTTVYVGEPAVVPPDLLEALRAVLPALPQVLEARVVQLVVDGDPSDPHPTVVLSLDPRADGAARSAAVEACGGAASAAGPVDVALLDELGGLGDRVQALPTAWVRPA